jgi:hypothetical protein
MIKARIAAVLGTLALIGMGQAALAPAASAAAPSCLGVSVSHPTKDKTTVLVFNGCSTTQHFIVTWSMSWDSQCYTLGVGKHLTDSNLWSTYTGLKSC